MDATVSKKLLSRSPHPTHGKSLMLSNP